MEPEPELLTMVYTALGAGVKLPRLMVRLAFPRVTLPETLTSVEPELPMETAKVEPVLSVNLVTLTLPVPPRVAPLWTLSAANGASVAVLVVSAWL